MKRDYSKLVDEINSDWKNTNKIIEYKIRETISEDDLDDAVENVQNIMWELKYEW